MSERFAPALRGEMNCRRAARVARELRELAPQLTCEVWAIAQGLAYVRVKGPTTSGIVELVLHTEREVAHFKQLLEA